MKRKATTVNATSTYSLPLVPAAVFLGSLTFLLFVPVLALVAVLCLAVVTLAGLIAAPILLARSVRRHWPFHLFRKLRLAIPTGVKADASSRDLGEPRSTHLPLQTKGIQ